MKVRLMFNNSSHDIEDDATATVLTLKSRLADLLVTLSGASGASGVAGSTSNPLTSNNQKWIYKGKVLQDGDVLSSSGFTDGDTIHVMQTAAPPPSPPSATTTTTTTSSSGSVTAPLPPQYPVPQFDNAMRRLLSLHASPADVAPSLSTILKIISNIIKNPYEEKYRKIKTSNKLIQLKIVSVSGALEVLVATGFAPMGEEYVMTISPVAWEVLVSCQRKLDLFLKKLESVDESALKASTEPPAKISAPASSIGTTGTGSGAGGVDPQQSAALQQFLMALATTSTTAQPGLSTTATDTKVSSF
jgi:hypothetical protein